MGVMGGATVGRCPYNEQLNLRIFVCAFPSGSRLRGRIPYLTWVSGVGLVLERVVLPGTARSLFLLGFG